MKNFIIAIATLVIIITLLVFQEDVNRIRRDVGRAQNAINQGISTAVLISEESEREGYIKYSEEAFEKAHEIIEENMPRGIDYDVSLEELNKKEKGIAGALEFKSRPFSSNILEGKRLEIKLVGRGAQIVH